jgi:Uma2 family endonuclease
LQIKKAVFDKADDWMRNGVAYLLIVDIQNRSFIVYDRQTWKEGVWELPLPEDVKVIIPCPDLFPGLEISLDDVRDLWL